MTQYNLLLLTLKKPQIFNTIIKLIEEQCIVDLSTNAQLITLTCPETLVTAREQETLSNSYINR